MFSYQSVSAKKASAFFHVNNCQTFFSSVKPHVDELLEGLAIETDKELELLIKCPAASKASLDAKAPKR
jgi:hypothetical protein